jgi:proline iminopeptidase
MASFAAVEPIPGRSKKRESALDRKIHLEADLVTQVPAVGRWCDRIDLSKKRIDIGGCELYVEEEGRGMPIVLINGGPGGTHHYFHPWFSRAKGFARVIYYDQRGCGLSDWRPGPGYSVEQAVGDLEHLRRALGIRRWVIMGYSYGGFLAQYYAIHFPESVAGLVLVSAMTGMHADMKPSRQMDYLSDAEISRLKAIRKRSAVFSGEHHHKERRKKFTSTTTRLTHLEAPGFFRPSPERAAQMALYEWKNDEDFNRVMGESVDRVDLTGAFEGCPIPTLIVEGTWDLTWNTDKPGILLENHPGARLEMFKRSGHNVYEDEPQKFFRLLKGFVGRLSDIPSGPLIRYQEYLADWRKKASH